MAANDPAGDMHKRTEALWNAPIKAKMSGPAMLGTSTGSGVGSVPRGRNKQPYLKKRKATR